MTNGREFHVGDLVKYADKLGHKVFPRYYPKPGTVGRVLHVDEDVCFVQWPEGSTSDADRWCVPTDRLVKAETLKDVRKLQALAALCCFAGMVLGVHALQLLLCRRWVEAACCCVGAAAALLKGMDLDQRAQDVLAVLRTGADDGKV